MTTLAADRYIVISSDGHAGGQIHEYRDYVDARYLDDFDAWAKTFVNRFEDVRGETAYRSWDSAARLRELEDDGVVGEVLFPNTIPPFFPSVNLLARPAAQVCPSVAEVATPLDEVPADSRSIAFAGERVKPW